jgi:hypothetical protein
MLTVRAVPMDATNEMAITDIESALGEVVAIDIVMNQVFSPNMLVAEQPHRATAVRDDRNGSDSGFWTVRPGLVDYPIFDTYLTGLCVVKYNTGSYVGIPAGLNSG